jgi:hypothetical protein
VNIDTTSVGRDLLALRDAFARNSAPVPGNEWMPVMAASRIVRTIRRGEADRELAGVHVAEVARLLREAVMLRCAANLSTGNSIPFPARNVWLNASDFALDLRTDSRDARGSSLVAWRRRARAELAQWRVDGFESAALLRACAARPIHRWADARELADAAFDLAPCDAARLCVACAALAVGCADRAVQLLEELLERDLDPSLRRAAVRALAVADRRRGASSGES